MTRQEETPIYDQLRVELAVQAVAPQLRVIVQGYVDKLKAAGHQLRRLGVALAEAQLGTPEDVLDRIRADQRLMDDRDRWREEARRWTT